eukprot:6214397-Pleurochrysis_carterae.AAC.5
MRSVRTSGMRPPAATPITTAHDAEEIEPRRGKSQPFARSGSSTEGSRSLIPLDTEDDDDSDGGSQSSLRAGATRRSLDEEEEHVPNRRGKSQPFARQGSSGSRARRCLPSDGGNNAESHDSPKTGIRAGKPRKSEVGFATKDEILGSLPPPDADEEKQEAPISTTEKAEVVEQAEAPAPSAPIVVQMNEPLATLAEALKDIQMNVEPNIAPVLPPLGTTDTETLTTPNSRLFERRSSKELGASLHAFSQRRGSAGRRKQRKTPSPEQLQASILSASAISVWTSPQVLAPRSFFVFAPCGVDVDVFAHRVNLPLRFLRFRTAMPRKAAAVPPAQSCYPNIFFASQQYGPKRQGMEV